jgi:hypothetical protein
LSRGLGDVYKRQSKFLSAVGKEIESWDPNRQWFQYV